MATPPMTEPEDPPALRRLLGEALAPLDALRDAHHLPRHLRRRPGPVRDVVVVPGYLASDRSTAVLRAVIARDGHRVRGWGLGRNTGHATRSAESLLAQVRAIAERARQPVDLVGWSLGGAIARTVAQRDPSVVRRIVTLATPMHGPHATSFAHRMRADALREGRERADSARRAPAPVPVTVIWSRRDGIVQWRSQQDRDNAWAEHVEVGATHLGMTFSPHVLAIVRDRIAADVTVGLRG